MAIKVYKQFRQIENSNGEFKINEHRKELRSSVKIDELEADNYNKIAKSSGIYYELNEQATKERDNLLNPKPKGRPKKEESKE